MRFALTLTAVVLLAHVAAAGDKPLTMGIPRPLSADTATHDAQLLGAYFTSALKRPLEAKTFENYDQLAQALATGEIDLAWITPLSYVKASRQGGVFPIAKALRHGLHYRAVFFVKADHKAKTLKDLKGAKVAWVDQGSAAGYLFPRGMLLKDGLKPAGYFSSEKFYGDHKSVCAAVLSGEAEAGATFANPTDPLEKLPVGGCLETHGADAAAKVRAVAVSDRIPNEVIAARQGFDEGVAAQLAGIFAMLSETDSGRKLLATTFRADGFGLALEQDFEPVRLVAQSIEAGRWLAKAERKSSGAVLLGDLPTAQDAEAGQKSEKPATRAAPKPAAKSKRGK